MNKLFSKIATLSVGLAIAVGVGVALGHESVREVRADDTTITPATSGWTSTAGAQTGTVSGITVATGNGVYNTQMRVYSGAVLTVSSSSAISKIVFTFSQGSFSGASVGTYSSGTWTGSATSIEFSNTAQVRITNMVVTTGGSVDPDPDPNPGTEDNPYTVAQALAATPANGKYVTGIISQIDEVSTSHGNATYYLSDDGTTTTQIKIYRGKYLNDESFTSTTQIAVGDVAVVYGNISAYKNVNQLAQGNYLTHLEHEEPTPVDPVTTIPEIYTADVGSPVAVDGYYVGQVSDGLYIMNGAYGIFVYHGTAPDGATIGETKLHVEGTSATFNNLYQIASGATITVSSAVVSTPINYTLTGTESTADLSVASRRIVEKGVITKITRDGTDYLPTYEGDVPTVDTTKDIFLTLGESLQVIYKKSDVTQAGFETLFAYLLNGKKVNLEAFTGFYKTDFQLRYSSVVEATEGYTAEKFAEDLMKETDEVCYGYDGVTDNTEALAAKWLLLQENVLSDEEVARFNDEDNDFAEERARYDYLVGKYGLTDFLLRNPAPIGGSNYNFAETSNNSYIIIIVISAVSVMSFGLALFLRKKRSK